MPSQEPRRSEPPESNPMLPAILALRDWARRFHLRSPYLMKVVGDAVAKAVRRSAQALDLQLRT